MTSSPLSNRSRTNYKESDSRHHSREKVQHLLKIRDGSKKWAKSDKRSPCQAKKKKMRNTPFVEPTRGGGGTRRAGQCITRSLFLIHKSRGCDAGNRGIKQQCDDVV